MCDHFFIPRDHLVSASMLSSVDSTTDKLDIFPFLVLFVCNLFVFVWMIISTVLPDWWISVLDWKLKENGKIGQQHTT